MTSQLLVVCDTDFYLYLFFYPASSLPQFVFTCQGQWLHLSAVYIVYMVISSWINKWMYDKPCNRCYCSLRLIKKKRVIKYDLEVFSIPWQSAQVKSMYEEHCRVTGILLIYLSGPVSTILPQSITLRCWSAAACVQMNTMLDLLKKCIS